MNELTTQKPISATSPEHSLWHWLTDPDPRRWFLPLTGLWILGVDWLLFPEDAMSMGLATPVIGLLLGGCGTYFFQRRFAGDNRPATWLKALVAGVVVGLPLPLAGTVVGGWILAASGLTSLKHLLRRG